MRTRLATCGWRDRPALYIETTGATTDPWTKPGDRPLRSLRGPTVGRVIRALCDFRPPYGVELLAGWSGSSLGSVSRVFTFLDSEGLIRREPPGPVIEVRWAELIRRWAEDYAFGKNNETRVYLEPRGLGALLEKLKQASFAYAVMGSLAASRGAASGAIRLAAVCVEDMSRAAESLRLRPAESGANVLLAEPFDRVVFERTWRVEAATFAAHSQVAVDLLIGSGRSPAEGEEVLWWMQEHEDAWRR